MGQFRYHPLFGSPEKTEYFEYTHMGETPFFRPLLVQAKFPAVDCESLTPTRGATQQSVGIKKKKERRWEAKWHSRGSPTKGSKIRSGCLTPTFLGAQKRAEVLRHPRVLGVHYRRGGKQKWPAPGSWKKSHSGGSLRAVLNEKKLVLKDHPASPGQWKKAPQSGGQDQKWPTSGQKVLQPSSFVFSGFET